MEPLRKATEHPAGGGWMPIPEGQHRGYRRPLQTGGFDYWYPSRDAAWAAHNHHNELADDAERYAPKEPKADAPAWEHEQHAREAPKAARTIAEHREIAAHAKRIYSSSNDAWSYGDEEKNPHRSRGTMGPDESKVSTAVADLLHDLVGALTSKGVYEIGPGMTATSRIRVRRVSGELVDIPIKATTSRGAPTVEGEMNRTRMKSDAPRKSRPLHQEEADRSRSISLTIPVGQHEAAALAEELRHVLSHEIVHAMDVIGQVAAKAHGGSGSSSAGPKVYYNDPIEVRAFKHNVFRELNTPKVAEEMRHMAHGQESMDDMDREDGLAAHGPRVAGGDVRFMLERHSATWKTIARHLSPETKREFLKTAARVLQAHVANESKPMEKGVRLLVSMRLSISSRWNSEG